MDIAERVRVSGKVWWLSAAWWLGFAIFDASRTVLGMQAVGMHHEWFELFLLYFLAWVPWFMATPAIMRLGQRLHLVPASLRSRAALAAGPLAMLLISSLWFGSLDAVLDPWLEPEPATFRVKLEHALYGWIAPTIILYAFLVGLGTWLRSRETLVQQRLETARLNEQLAVAELNALRQQIEPHFLFNTLNGIVGLMREQRIEPAIGTIIDLSELLRGTLQRSNRPLVTLLEELELLGRYLDIQKTRFGERLAVTIEVPAELYALLVPAPILQPLVENAIKHGIERREHGGCIRIRVQRCSDALQIRVYNDGPALSQVGVRAGSGIGLANLRKRLDILFPERCSLQLADRDAGVEVSVSLPMTHEKGACAGAGGAES